MTAILSLISPKAVFYGIIVSLLLAFGVHYKHLSEQVQAEKQAAAAAQVLVKKDDAAAQSTETENAIIYKQAVAIPPVGDLGIECVRHPASGGALPTPDTKPGAAAREQPANSGAGPGYDPSGAALARAAAADAQIKYLQGRVHELETQMKNAP